VAGQVLLVSGASRGIGRAIARASPTAGATVVHTGRDAATLEQTARDICPPGGNGPARGSATWPTRLRSIGWVTTVLDEFGRVDTLLNVAGVNRRMPSSG